MNDQQTTNTMKFTLPEHDTPNKPSHVSEPAAPVWIWVVGIGDDGLASLGEKARALIAAADLVVGGSRHLAMLPDDKCKRLAWRRPLEKTLEDIEAHRGGNVVVLASGDPLWFGVGDMLVRTFGIQAMQVLPHASSFSLACARLGWPLAETETLSLHNRPTSTLRRYLSPDARLVLLTHDGETAHIVATILVEQGYAASQMTVFEHLGGEKERQIEATADTWQAKDIAPLNTIAIHCVAGPLAVAHSSLPGLPDDVFESDGMLTKREVRAATLARLMPINGQCLWDVGAGSGAIAIEWLRCLRQGHAIAIERDEQRALRAKSNAEWLGVPELHVIRGDAPDCFDDGFPAPDAIFIGGGITAPGMLAQCYERLSAGGRLVANIVTLEGERLLLDWQAAHGGDLVRIAISRAEKVGPFQGWRPGMPVTQYAMVKS